MSSSANRIAANTIVMYIRMLFLIIIAFFTSRLLLSTLGIEDFGIQSVVGSISTTFVSLKALFSESVQRYLNYEKGRNSLDGQRSVFSLGILIHFILAIVFVIVVEVIGCWLISNKLDIPAEKIETAFFVFHMTVIAVFISIFSIPYDAVIIANEKMGVYAFVTIIDALLKLGAVLVISWIGFNKLRIYSALLILVPLFTLSFQLIYCRRFPECKFSKQYDKSLFKKLLSLSGWNFLGNITFSLVHEGVNMLLNMFGGLVYNAARTVSYQVKSVASQISSNTIISARPKIMQRAAADDKQIVFNNINAISRVSFFTIFLPICVLLTYTDQLLDIWLVDVPESAANFTRLLLVGVAVRSLHDPLNVLYMAYAKIKRMMLIEAIVMISFLLIIYVSLKAGAPIWIPFAEMILMESVIIAGLLINAKKELAFTSANYIKQVLLPFLAISTITIMLCFSFNKFVPANGFMDTLVKCVLVAIVYMCIAFLLLNQQEKNLLKNLANKIIKKK